MKTQTNVLGDSSVEVKIASSIVRTVLADWSGGNIAEAADQFDDQFTFIDHALDLEFKDKNRLIEFMTKTHEFFPDAARTDNAIFTSENRVISEWELTDTQPVSFPGGSTYQQPIRTRGITVVRMKNGKISEWSEYYDRRMSGRERLAAWFTEWTEL